MVFNCLKKFIILLMGASLPACASSIQSLGNIGPKKLGVYVVAHNDFLTASRMVVILDKKGNVAAYTGGTASGFGAVAMQTTGELATAGAIVYGARAVQQGVQHSNVKVSGVPKSVNLKADINVNGKFSGM